MQQTDHVVKRKKNRVDLSLYHNSLFNQSYSGLFIWFLTYHPHLFRPTRTIPIRSIPFLPILRSCLGLSFISFFNVIPIHHTLLIMGYLLLSSVYVSLYWQNVLLFQNYHSRGILNYMRGRPDKAVSDLKVCDVIFTKSRWMNRTMLIMRDALK